MVMVKWKLPGVLFKSDNSCIYILTWVKCLFCCFRVFKQLLAVAPWNCAWTRAVLRGNKHPPPLYRAKWSLLPFLQLGFKKSTSATAHWVTDHRSARIASEMGIKSHLQASGLLSRGFCSLENQNLLGGCRFHLLPSLLCLMTFYSPY